MRFPWSRPTAAVDRSDELAAAAKSNEVLRADVHQLRDENRRRFARVSYVAEALLHEGAQNHFTQRIETALITSLNTRGNGR